MVFFSIIVAAISVVTDAIDTDTVEKLHPVEQYCIEYKSTDLLGDGWTKICSREYGTETYIINYKEGAGRNFKTGEKWVTVCQSHTILVGGRQYYFDLNDDVGIAFEDRQYAERVAAASAYFENESANAYHKLNGFEPTGTQQIVADLPCEEYENTDQHVRRCYTKDLLMLKSTGIGSVKFELSATNVEIGVIADDENYRLFEIRSYQELGENMSYNFICKRKE